MTAHRKNIWPTLILCATLLGLGGVAGFMLRPILLPVAQSGGEVDEQDDAPAEDDAHGSSSIVELLESTLENMDLQTGKFELRDYYQNIRIPARIVERVPQNRRRVSAPISGRVVKVWIVEGQAVRPGAKLFDFRITDEALGQSQVDLLGVIASLDVNQKKLERLTPLVESGVVANKRRLDVEFEISSLKQQRDALRQDLFLRGMDEHQIKNLIDNKQLMQTISIFAPELSKLAENPGEHDRSGSEIQQVSMIQISDEQYYSVESISALEGTRLDIGASLCELTHHGDLLIEGHAYESDIEKISQGHEQGWRFTAQFGEGDAALVRENLKLYKFDNHVDNQSQTYPVFVEIENEIASRTTDEEKRTYVNWRFKPGQRVHLEFPIDIWHDQVVVPLGALVREGPEAFVFMKISHTHESPAGTVHEFQKVPVKVLHTDKRNAVLAKSVRLDVYEEYALDQAYKLNLALKQAAGGGHAGHGHDHDH